MQAIILAAGMGSRIRSHHDKPKGFICIHDQEPIIARSLGLLQLHGIQRIAIIAGYQAHHYQELAKQYQQVDVIVNTHYAQTGSLESLLCAYQWLTQDCVIVESDLIYEGRALNHLLKHSNRDAIVTSGYTHSGDEVYVTTQQNTHQQVGEQLVDMSKQRDTLNAHQHIIGEFVGISKLSVEAMQQLVQLAQTQPLNKSAHYETDGLVLLAQHRPIQCVHLADLKWAEIDNLAHWQRAKQIYPQLDYVN